MPEQIFVLNQSSCQWLNERKSCKATLKIRSQSEVGLITYEPWRMFFIVTHQESWRIQWSRITCRFILLYVIQAYLKIDVD